MMRLSVLRRLSLWLIINLIVDAKIARIFNTYGERMRKKDGRAIPAFIDQALRGEPLTVFGKGRQSRSFCYVDDLTGGIYKLATSKVNNPVNIGNPHEMSILRLAKVIKKITGSKSKIIYKPLPVDDPKVRRPDIQRAMKILRWKPKTQLEEGLRRTIAWFKRR